MATDSLPRASRKGDPEGRMPLREHFIELRRRVVRAALAMLVGAIVGWFLYFPVINYLDAPVQHLQHQGHDITLNFSQVGAPFDLRIKMSIWLGILISSPVWIYQLWAFVTPGLTHRERRYALGFVAAAVPLFLSGVYLATFFVPNALDFFSQFTPRGGSQIINWQDYIGFELRTAMAFGAAFLLPVVLVGLNLAGILAGRAVLRAWRWVTVGVFVFAAVATPTPDITSMFVLAVPMLVLFALAIVVCLFNDRRKARAVPDWGSIADDEASAL